MENKITINLGKNLDIRHVGTLKNQLLSSLHDEVTHCILEARQIERADSAGLQLIVAFVKEAKSRGVKISWHKPSAEFIKSSTLLGMSRMINLEIESGAY
jgi:anti-anti-sigma factor